MSTARPPTEPAAELVTREQNHNRDDQSAHTPELRAIDDAFEALGDKASNRDICHWIDLHRELQCPYHRSKRSDGKWETYYENAGREARKPLEEMIRRRRVRYRARK